MSQNQDTYRTIKEPSKGIFKDKGSKFLSFAYPVNNIEDVEDTIKSVKKIYHDARHHCYAFVLGPDQKTYRASDDGEPSNSSGPPILGQIRSKNLTNVLIVIPRYFGGTKLGIPGLINAYKSAAEDALEKAKIIEKTIKKRLKIEFQYPNMGDVMRLIKEHDLTITEQDFRLDCKMIVEVRISNVEKVLQSFKPFYEVTVSPIDE
jgi:uncharacterized YigZ family protein